MDTDDFLDDERLAIRHFVYCFANSLSCRRHEGGKRAVNHSLGAIKKCRLSETTYNGAAISRASNLIQSQQTSQSDESSGFLIGGSTAVTSLKEAIAYVSTSSSPVLLQGEKNALKSLIAARISQSQASEDSNAPFVVFNCKDTDANSIRGKLLGEDKLGGTLLKEAKGGTLLIENIDALPRESQSEAVDMINGHKAQTRFIFSTSGNLEQLVEKGAFDDSLYYRISSHTIDVPSLKERSEDIPLIAKSILSDLGKDEVQIGDRAQSLLQSYRWPGNFKELQEAIEHAAGQCSDGTIHAENLPERVNDLSEWSKLADYIEEATLEYKRRVLQACQGDLELATEVLGCEQGQLPSS